MNLGVEMCGQRYEILQQVGWIGDPELNSDPACCLEKLVLNETGLILFDQRAARL